MATAAGIAVTALLISAWAYAPALGAYYYLDDFAFVAIARYTDHPLAYYLSQHFPGGFFYRPSGMLLWWTTVAANLSPTAQYALDWLLLAAAALLLWRLLLAQGISPAIAAAAAGLFALHPIAVTTAGWLSNRFDLLAAVGLLVALLGASAWDRGRPRAGVALVALGTALAVTAKELGFITPLVMPMLVRGRWQRRVFAMPFIVSATIAASVFAVRAALLPGTDRILYPDGVADAARQGLAAWLRWLAPFVAYLPDHPRVASAMVIAFVGAVGAALYIANRDGRARESTTNGVARRLAPAIATGAAIFALAGLVQSPTVAYSKIAAPTGRAFDGEAFFAARFYYVALIGLVIAGAGIVDALADMMRSGLANADAPHRALPLATSAVDRTVHRTKHSAAFTLFALAALLAVPLLAAYWGWQGRVQQSLWANEAAGLNRSIAEAAAAAVATLAPSAAGDRPCRIYIVDTMHAAPRFWPFSDAIVKAAVDAPTARALSSCLISTEHTPWYQVRRRDRGDDGAPSATAPLEPICVFGKVFPPLRFDTVRFDYLAYPRDGATLTLAAGDRVLRYDTTRGRFDDITDAVRRGDATVALRWSRPDSNACPPAKGTGS